MLNVYAIKGVVTMLSESSPSSLRTWIIFPCHALNKYHSYHPMASSSVDRNTQNLTLIPKKRSYHKEYICER